jgi:hypothetical protein
LLEEPFFDSETNFFVWLFSGLSDFSEILQSPIPSPFTLSAHAFFEPIEPSLPSLSAFDFLPITFSLPQDEESEGEEGEEKTASETGKESSGDSQTVSGKEEEERETRKVARRERISGSKFQSAKEAILKDPESARKAFEREIAAKAISCAKKNPKSKAKGDGIVITVGAYPQVLPADGKSTAFIVAKVTDEKGKPIAGKEVVFSSTGGQILVKRVRTDEQGLAFSRICSDLLQKGQRKVVKVRAKVNPEAETEVTFDGNMVLTLNTSNVSVYAFCYWKKITPNGPWVCTPKPPYCEGEEENGVSGLAGIAMHVITPLGYWTAYPNYIEVIGDGHPNQFRSDYDRDYFDYDQNAPCPPPPDPSNPNQQRFRFSWQPEITLGWVEFHRSPFTIKINYTVGRYYPYPPQFWTETKTFIVNAVNAVLKIDPNSPKVLAWDSENPDPSKLTVKFDVETLQIGRVWVWMRIYSCERANGEGPIRVIQTETTTNTPTPIAWDGRDDSGEVAGIGGGTIIGHVGTGEGWPGNNMLIRRWNFGMTLTGAGRFIDRMVLLNGTRATYTLHPNVRNFPYGLSGIGVLIWRGRARNLDDDDDRRIDEDDHESGGDSSQVDNDNDGLFNEDPDWPDSGSDRPRTAIAWDNRGHFYLIVFEGGRDWGVTWEETVNFFRTELPRWMCDELPSFVANEPAYEGARIAPQVITIQDAIMLDGGSSTQFIWRWAQRRRRLDGSWVPPIRRFYRGQGVKVPTLLEAHADAP